MTDPQAVGSHRPCWLSWRVAVALLAISFLLSPAVISIPHRPPPPPHAAAAPTEMWGACIEGTGPEMPLFLCAAIEAAFPRHPIMPILLFTLVLLALAVARHERAPAPQNDGWWPLGRRRALLQVFQM